MVSIEKLLSCAYYDIFEDDAEKIKSEYRILVKKYHPDVCSDPRAANVLLKIQNLYKEAEEHNKNKTWKESNVLSLHRSDGKVALIKNYKYQTSNEMGRIWVSNTCICYEFESSKKKYFDNYLIRINSIKYANEKMREHFFHFIPTILDSFKAEDKYYIIVKNWPELCPLDLVKDVFKKPEHAAWLTTKILDICNFLQFNGLTHNGICAENCFINFEMHSVHLLGGWQYSVPVETKLLGMPKKVFDNIGILIPESKKSQYLLDLSASKDMVRETVGGHSYIKLIDSGFAPLFSEFLFQKPSEEAFEEYSKWEDIRQRVWSKHEFIKVDTPTGIWVSK